MDAHILIVEDDPDISTIAATHLCKLGYSRTQAFSGSEAQMGFSAQTQTHRTRST